VPKSRQRSILSIRWHWPALTAFGPFWTVARHRMAIVPGDQFALWASAAPGGFHALGSVTAGAEEVPGKDPCWPDPAEGERLTWRVQKRGCGGPRSAVTTLVPLGKR
jgi:hypothetical protein